MSVRLPQMYPRQPSYGSGKSVSQNRSVSQRGNSPVGAFQIQNAIQRPPYRQRGRGGRYAKENYFDKRPPTDATSKIKVMENILQKEPYMIAIELLQKNSGYEVFLNDADLRESKYGLSLNDADLKVSKIVLVIKLLVKSLSSRANDEGAIDLLFITFKNVNFCQNLMIFVSDMKYKTHFAKDYLPIIGSIIAQFIRLSPNNAFPILTNLVDLCRGVVIQLQMEKLSFADSLVQIFDNIQTQMKETRSSFILAQKASDQNYLNGEEPPDDFRDHDVIPTCTELNVLHKPFLRPNKVQGRYKDSNHYLDVQFRLLKEDFIRPLRLGVQEYKKFHNKTKYKDARMYQNVMVDSTAIERNEFVYYLKLNLPKGLNIENSKRLMFGNILCISHDDFETLIVATIFGRDKLQNQLIAVKLETEPFQLKRNQIYTVIESKAYFVSYMHALKALQEIREVPLKKYIVEVEETYTPPDYLSRLSSYKQRRVIRNNNIKQIENLEFKVLDSIDNWPSAAMLRLDESQRQALYGALTRKMAIIQGPPGTGKTHLGLLITRILLENKENWNFQSSHPLLVVCVTNHALDQFLEGMLKFTNKICRVGSRSQNEALEEYQINKLMFNSRDINLVNDRYNVLKSGLKEMQYVINVISKIIKKIDKPGIINYDYFNSELGIIIPACFTPLIGVSMRNFLTINYDDNTISKNNKNDDKKEESKNADSNDTNDADEEILKEERNRMLVQSDDEEEIQIESLHYEIVGLTKLPELQFDSTPTDIAETINKFESHIKRKPFDINNKVYAIQIEMLKREERAIKVGENVTFTKDEIRDIEAKADVNLDFISRWKLYKYWKCKLSKIYQRKLSSLERSHLKLSKSMTSLKDLKYLNVMKNVDVVGMTTTGAAHYCKVLHDLAPPIVIVEEAAEILEAHIVASLSESCQHLILIGDHQQLRPKPEVYELCLHYQMDTSFFERMIRNGVLYHTLEYQHRMRPAISNLLVPTVYPNLKDHRAVFSYPHIRGVKKDLFFVDHNVYERDNNFEETESFQNPYEAEFLMGLCRYLVYQGYGNSDITIITPYFGQYRYLKQLQKKSEFQNCSEIRISVLDNYQGEESNIILLSLVRSNEEGRVGFVKVDNRITVALSRAKHGMFIIGNMSQMAESSILWREIQNKLISGGNIGSKMKLVCSNHPNEIMEVKSLEDFNRKTPKGGCSIPCTEILPGCGHRCPSLCHIIDKDHLQTKCTHRCAKKLCELSHQCPKLCYQKCDKCIAPVEKLLPCGHVHPVECSTDPKLFKCSTKVRRQLPSCKHIFDLECHVDISTYKCPMKCGTLLPCGNPCILTCHPMHEEFGISNLEKIPLNCDCSHKCINKCHEPLGSCNIIIDKLLNCGHVLKKVKCGMPEKEMICIQKCQRTLACKHKCQLACGVKCGNCMVLVEKVIPECKHKIKFPCSIKPEIRYCTKTCVKRLPCAHPCRQKCYQICTSQCMEMVETKFKCQRKHRIKLIPCYLKKQRPVSLETLSIYCTEICKKRLGCGHFCEEKCNVPCPFNCPACEADQEDIYISFESHWDYD